MTNELISFESRVLLSPIAGEDLLLRRHDYNVNVAGGFAAAQLTSDYVVANGIHLPTMRRLHARKRGPILEMLMVSIDISEVRFE